jgi:hypothetical protein
MHALASLKDRRQPATDGCLGGNISLIVATDQHLGGKVGHHQATGASLHGPLDSLSMGDGDLDRRKKDI